MNNLRYFRDLCNAKRAELSSLMNVTAYTYQGYEQGRILLPPETVILISKIYGIIPDEIFDEPSNIPESTIQRLKKLSGLTKSQRHRCFVTNLTGKEQDKLSYTQIGKIIASIKNDIANNTK